jgi:4-carboxymuconolactone decarboxylase
VLRATPLRPEAMDQEQRRLYDAIVGGPRGTGPQVFELRDADGVLNGPFNSFLLSPRMGEALQSVGVALRFNSSLSPRLRELAILLVAAHWHSEFEWYAHERVGRSVGVTDAELQALQSGNPPHCPDAAETAGLRLVSQLLTGDVSDDAFATARAELGEATIFELSTLVGYYGTLALQLRLFRVGVPSDDA